MNRKTSDRIYGWVCAALFGLLFWVFVIRTITESF